MKKIITQVQSDSIYLDKLQGNEIVAYACVSGKSHSILRKVIERRKDDPNKAIICFGFINLLYPSTSATFLSTNSMRDSIQKAMDAKKHDSLREGMSILRESIEGRT